MGKTISRNNRGQSKRTSTADTFLQLPILSWIYWTARSHLPSSTQRKGAESRWHFNYIEGLWADSMTSLSPCVSLTFLHLHLYLLPIPPRPYLCVQQLRPFKKSQRSRGDPISTWALTHTHVLWSPNPAHLLLFITCLCVCESVSTCVPLSWWTRVRRLSPPLSRRCASVQSTVSVCCSYTWHVFLFCFLLLSF